MLTNVFTYGSLMFPEVWERVVQGKYRAVPATVADHARFSIVGETYPGMIEQVGGAVSGIVYVDVDADDVAALDVFEGEDYRRALLDARLDTGTVTRVATYLYLPVSRLAPQPWLPEAFQMQRFLATYCRDKLGS